MWRNQWSVLVLPFHCHEVGLHKTQDFSPSQQPERYGQINRMAADICMRQASVRQTKVILQRKNCEVFRLSIETHQSFQGHVSYLTHPFTLNLPSLVTSAFYPPTFQTEDLPVFCPSSYPHLFPEICSTTKFTIVDTTLHFFF